MSESPITYEIRVEGLIDDRWADWFDGMTITHEENAQTRLVGLMPDQAALQGALERIRDLGLKLISVRRIGGDPGDHPAPRAGFE